MSQATNASARLSEGRNELLSLWEKLSRKLVGATRGKDSHTVRDELTHFLTALAENLRVEKTNSVPLEKISAKHHGQQRAGITGYTLMETVHEYGLLRKVIIQFLLEGGSLTEKEREVIHETVDNAVRLASNEFAEAEQAKIKLALAKAESSNRDLEQFAAVAAHDLRSPLNSIAGFTEILQNEFKDNASGEAQESMKFIRSAVRRMVALIEGILSYARLSRPTSEKTIFSAEEPVKAATQNLKAEITHASGRISHPKLPEVLGDLPLLTQLFQNLFANALRYRGEEFPAIEVSSRAVGNDWEFCVSDNGVGFDPKYKDVIFEVHKQLHTDRRFEGTGLGLATCRRVVELHGGRMWADSEIGRGSRFIFTLPQIICAARPNLDDSDIDV